MSIKYYRTAFESDIFYQKQLNKPLPLQKFIFNYSLRPKDKVLSLSSYMEKEHSTQELFHIKVFTSKQTDVLNTLKKYVPSQPREYGLIHHLSKSQIHLGDDDLSSYNITKHKPKSVGKYPEQESAFQRKLSEFYGRDYSNKFATISNHHSSHNLLKNEIYANDNTHMLSNQNRSFSTICVSHSSTEKAKAKKIKVTRAHNNQNKTNRSQFENRVDFLKSNIFNDPDKDIINEYHTITHKETEIDTCPIQFQRKLKGNVNHSFDVNNKMSDYQKHKPKLTAKERKLNNLYCSFDTIPIKDTNENTVSELFDTKRDLEYQTIRYLKGKNEALIKKQLENVSAMNGSGFYSQSYQLNSQSNAKEEISHKFEINDIKDQDLKQIKQYFSNNGIHLYDTTIQNQGISSNAPQKITVKIRENANDENFHCNLIKVQEKLKNDKGLEMKKDNKQAKKTDSIINQSKKDIKTTTFKKTNTKNIIRKKENLTAIPFDVKYKNEYLKR